MTWGQQNTEAEAHEQLACAADYGVNFFDTAEMYPICPARETQGRTSHYLGSWLRGQRRQDVVVASKVAGRSGDMPWIPANRTEPRGEEAGARAAAWRERHPAMLPSPRFGVHDGVGCHKPCEQQYTHVAAQRATTLRYRYQKLIPKLNILSQV
jgi:Aldo/keto reductase family